ncbi:MAG: elongation factor G [Nitrospira sp.]|nr:elongation factor G [Nitrospira sp.]MBH0184774.1 elongation factor G [Nitrospira sp.]
MDNIRMESMRNVAIVSNVGAGKTSLSEAILFASGAIPILGSITQGTTVSDFEPEELHHRSSVSTSVLQFSWNQTAISLLDPPGALSLLGEPLSALRAVDAVLIVLDGQAGVRTELSRLWGRIGELGLPCLFFVNGLDRDGASIQHALEMCRTQLDCIPIPMVLPVGLGPQTEGVIDLFQEQFIRSGPSTPRVETLPIPVHLESAAKEGHVRLMEAVAETEDALLDAYVAQGALDHDALFSGLRSGILRRQVFPLYAGSAVRNLGIWPLIHAMAALLPSPGERCAAHPVQGVQLDTGRPCERKGSVQEPFSAFVFKTLIDPFVGRLSYCRLLSGTVQADSLVWNASKQVREKLGHFYTLFGKRHTPVASALAGDIVAIGKLHDTHTGDTLCDEKNQICYPAIGLPRPVLSFAIEAKSKAEIEKVSLGLHKLIEEDPTLEFSRNSETKEMVLGSLGQLHIDLALEKLHRKFGADVTLHTPKIPYHETVHMTARAQGKYKKQTGGHGQYGDCWLEVAPLPRGGGFIFEHRVVGGAIPRQFIPAVEKGVSEAMHEGVLSGFPVVDVRVAVYDGSYHVVDSSDMSFKIAGSMAFKKAMEMAQPVLLEPMMTVEIEAPTDTVGAVMGDLNARRGRILSVNASDHAEQIVALVPLAELLKYALALNGMTGGRGSYAMEFSRYEEVPRELSIKIADQHKTERQAVGAH